MWHITHFIGGISISIGAGLVLAFIPCITLVIAGIVLRRNPIARNGLCRVIRTKRGKSAFKSYKSKKDRLLRRIRLK
jgi:hypothetical protein